MAGADNLTNKGKGRPKGVPNKATAAIKDMIIAALDQAHPEGGVAYLVSQAGENPTAFMGLVGKVLPLQIAGMGKDGEHIIATIERRVIK